MNVYGHILFAITTSKTTDISVKSCTPKSRRSVTRGQISIEIFGSSKFELTDMFDIYRRGQM